MLPSLALKRDRLLPIIVAGSLLLHASVLLPLLLRDGRVPDAPREIPVELVQMPPPKPPEATAPARPEQPAKPKPVGPKPVEPKPVEPKPRDAKPADPKPNAEKAAARAKPHDRTASPKPAKREAQQLAPRPPAPPTEDTAQRMKDLLGDASTSIAGPSPTEGPATLGAVALPGTAADGSVEVSYPQLVMSRVAKAKKQGRYAGTPGRARVSFTLSDTGEPESIVVVTPSGDPSLDEEAVAMIKRGAPYPAPPPGARRDFVVGLQFRPETE